MLWIHVHYHFCSSSLLPPPLSLLLFIAAAPIDHGSVLLSPIVLLLRETIVRASCTLLLLGYLFLASATGTEGGPGRRAWLLDDLLLFPICRACITSIHRARLLFGQALVTATSTCALLVQVESNVAHGEHDHHDEQVEPRIVAVVGFGAARGRSTSGARVCVGCWPWLRIRVWLRI